APGGGQGRRERLALQAPALLDWRGRGGRAGGGHHFPSHQAAHHANGGAILIRFPSRRRIATALICAAVCALGACQSEDLKVATLTVSSIRGLDCRETALNTTLAARLQATHGKGSVVIDYLRLGGVPHCRPREIGDWCVKHT